MSVEPPGAAPDRDAPHPPGGLRRIWNESLRFRLTALGLMPLVIVFPIVLGVLIVLGGEHANRLMHANLQGSLAGSRNYLEQVKSEISMRLGQIVHSERLGHLLNQNPGSRELHDMLRSLTRSSGLDYLLITTPSGRVIVSSYGTNTALDFPSTFVTRQAKIGLTNAAFEAFDGEQMRVLAQLLPETMLQTANGSAPEMAGGLVINAAAHFPLTADHTDGLLIGGILLNRDVVMLDHMREIIFPVGALPGNAEGLTSLQLGDQTIAMSRQRTHGRERPGETLKPEIRQKVLDEGQTWIGTVQLNKTSYRFGYSPILDGEGKRIGMIGTGFPDAPFQQSVSALITTVVGLLALTMLSISFIFLRTGRELGNRLKGMADTMLRIGQGKRDARIEHQGHPDELDKLATEFNRLLDTIARQDELQRVIQQGIVDEAKRRRALFEHERDGIAVLNADGSIFEANPKFMQMLGYRHDELAGLKVSDWDPLYPDGRVQKLLQEMSDEGLFFESIHRRKDGSTYVAEVSISRARWANTAYWLLLIRDISERKQIETELISHREHLAQLVEARTRELNLRSEQLDTIFSLSPDGLVSFDREGQLTFANDAFQRMTGLDLEDILGCSETEFHQRIHARSTGKSPFPEMSALHAAGLHPADRNDKNRRRLSFELSSPSERVIEVALRRSESDHVSQVLYFRDITHETAVDRMKSEFLSTAAHELRTPMASIYGYSELLLNMPFEPEVRHEMLSTVVRQCALMTSIIDELLDLARIEARRGKDFVLEPLTLDKVVRDSVSGFKPPGNRAAPDIEPVDFALPVRVDRKKMQQAITNILSNAYKYSPAGGQVSLRYRQEQRDGESWLGIEIEDHGIGMSPAELDRVCERFYRADKSGNIPGTGLGMSIVKEIIELHGGHLALRSTQGEGTVITLWLPALR